MSVSTKPGATLLTVMFKVPSSRARERVNPTIDDLVVLYTERPE
jgi:hypothetical protein